jgi:MoxR-like ATPase
MAAAAFHSVDEVIGRLAGQDYICDRKTAMVVYLAGAMQRPILVEGPAGVGKTELAKVLARSLGLELIRLQCYEGLDETKALYEWEYAKQLLYTQILKDKVGELLAGAQGLRQSVDRIAAEDEVFFSEKFLLPRPLLRAILAPQPVVLLIDEIDKSDAEFEAFLFEVLSDFQVTVPELGTLKARHVPWVVLTSNNSREVSDGLKRRCLYLYLDFPDPRTELEIVRLKVPGAGDKLARQAVEFLYRLRKLDLKKRPSVSETLDWIKALTLLHVQALDDKLVNETLATLLKHEEDARRAREEMKQAAADLQTRSDLPANTDADKDFIH